MRLSFPDGATTVLTYCTNVHPIEDLADARAALSRYCKPVRERCGAETLALGLWLSRRAASELVASDEAMAGLARDLTANGLQMVTLNGFPYGNFHAERVKEDVYLPDWASPERSRYTLDLARIMSRLLPDDVAEGTISTLPLTWGPTRTPSSMEDGAAMLVRLAGELERLAGETGRAIRVCVEPEPGCVVETTDQAVELFERYLRPMAPQLGVSALSIERHLGLCFDACHQAVLFEDAQAAWQKLEEHGIRVGKVQLSCALSLPAHPYTSKAELLAPFDEPRFLHQVRARPGAGLAGARLAGQEDIGPALFGEGALPRDAEWRVHFHVPLHWQPEGGALSTTRAELTSLLGAIARTRPLPHLEVETYTWNVLPPSMRPRDDETLVEGIASELAFAERALSAVGATRSV